VQIVRLLDCGVAELLCWVAGLTFASLAVIRDHHRLQAVCMNAARTLTLPLLQLLQLQKRITKLQLNTNCTCYNTTRS
jgi:hypothetical protein